MSLGQRLISVWQIYVRLPLGEAEAMPKLPATQFARLTIIPHSILLGFPSLPSEISKMGPGLFVQSVQGYQQNRMEIYFR